MTFSFFGKLLFNQINPLVRKAHEYELEGGQINEEDLPEIPFELERQINEASENFPMPLKQKSFRYFSRLLFRYRRQLVPAYLLYASFAVLTLAAPSLVHYFLSRLEVGDLSWLTWASGVGLASSGLVAGLSLQQYFVRSLRLYQMISSGLNKLIYDKSLKMSLNLRTQSQLGDVLNHMSSDAEVLADMPMAFGDLLWEVSITIGVGLMMFVYLGWTAIVPIAMLAGLVPLTYIIAKRFVKFDEQMMKRRDERVTLMGQILSAIRVVKYFAWEKAISAEVEGVRKAELLARKKLARSEVLSSLCYRTVGALVLFAALYVHAWRGFAITPAIVFTCISLFALLEEPFQHLSQTFSRLTQALVAVKRIGSFLAGEEFAAARCRDSSQNSTSSNIAFSFDSASFSYAKDGKPVISDINLEIQKGESLAVVGPVGSGKSSLLYSLLGEISIRGHFQRHFENCRMAYVPQEAFIINASLIENLKFGASDLSEDDVLTALYLADFERDLRALPAGLNTEIGEKGLNLSGGQKQRVSLARAILSRPQVVLLDDPLSAVDPNTEKALCDRLIFQHWNRLTRIVVTHRLSELERFDRVLFLKDGRVEGLGSFQVLLEKNSAFRQFYESQEKIVKKEDRQLDGQDAESALFGDLASVIDTQDASSDNKAELRLTVDEDRERGAVKASVYLQYLSALAGQGRGRWFMGLTLFVGAVGTALFPVLQQYWMAHMKEHLMTMSALRLVTIYGCIGLGVMLFGTLNSLFWLERGIRAGQELHERMLQSILKTSIRFFDATPVGRILQRFSRDIESVDTYLQWSFLEFIACALNVTVALGLIVSLMPSLLLVIIPVMWVYYQVQRAYRRPAREVKRLDSIARSPRFAHFKETLQGLVVIRAFDRKHWFYQKFLDRFNHSQRMFYGHYMLNRWFSSRIPLIGSAISMFSILGILVSVKFSAMSAGVAGLVTIYALSFWRQLNWAVRIFADIESRMTSVERLRFYSGLPPEKEISNLKDQEPLDGSLQVHDLWVRYSDHLPAVLKGLSISIPAGSKTGIVGRTGSGKSTLFQSFYRFVEFEKGRIELGGIDITTMSLYQLRRSLAIVPQDPTLFLGTLRSNLDRYNEFSDSEVLQSLQKVGMQDFVLGLPGQLQFHIEEGGYNLSQGQRQLLCLARAFLIKAKVILMDEATASVDVETDSKIQEIISKRFDGVTMVIIAHRLGTLKDCDQIIELSDGQVVARSTARPQNHFNEVGRTASATFAT